MASADEIAHDAPMSMQTRPEDVWSPWTPTELASRLAGLSAPWCVVGGWALDLWHGRETREHEDIEFTILADDLPRFRRALAGMAFHTAHDGTVTPLAPAASPGPGISQIWCWDLAAGCWRADMMLERGTPETWFYKRDPGLTCTGTQHAGHRWTLRLRMRGSRRRLDPMSTLVRLMLPGLALLLACPGSAKETIVGTWAIGGACGKPLSVVVIEPMGLGGEDFTCAFRTVSRRADTVRWSGRCNFSEGGDEPARVVATLDGPRLRYRFVGQGWNGPFLRCTGR
ncbi:nucleotidyltransferase domain-containing protein [Enterovirga rhinocerotis]|nr:hypothetical protein [Enterovirga rhinocerotis]